MGIEIFHFRHDNYLDRIIGSAVHGRMLQGYIDLGYTIFQEVVGYGYHPALFQRPGMAGVHMFGAFVNGHRSFRRIMVMHFFVGLRGTALRRAAGLRGGLSAAGAAGGAGAIAIGVVGHGMGGSVMSWRGGRHIFG